MPIKFPKDFLFGTATSAYQIEGGNKNCDWWNYEQARKLPYKSGKACDFWHKWKEDIKLMKNLGYNAFRFSIEWSRVIPKKGKVNEGALKKYSKIVDFCLDNKVEPLIVLWHFTLPQWFAKLGGFEKRENLRYWKNYVEVIVDKLGDKVKLWGPRNESAGHAYVAYIKKYFPPFKSNPQLYKKILGNYFLAYSQAYELIKEINPGAMVGPVIITSYVEPVSEPTENDINAAKIADRYFHGFQLETLDKLRLPSCLGRGEISGVDFLGINYYSRTRIKYDPLKPLGFSSAPPPALAEISEVGWEVYPKGFDKVLKRYWKEIRKPIIVTENGIPTYDDKQRCRFLLRYLMQLKKAMDEGCDIRGYFHWSFMDNFEWREGFRQRFGLVKVNYKTFERKPRESAKIYGKIARNKTISDEILEKFKIEI